MFERTKKQTNSLYSQANQLSAPQQPKLKILRHLKTNSTQPHIQNPTAQNSTSSYNNEQITNSSRFCLSRPPPSNTQIIVNLILSKVDLPKIRRSSSIPYMSNAESRVSTKQTKYECEKNNGNNGSFNKVGFKIRRTSEQGECTMHSSREQGREKKQHQDQGENGDVQDINYDKDRKDGEEQVGEQDILSPRKVRRCTMSNFKQTKTKVNPNPGQKIVIVSTSKLNPEVSININIKQTLKAKLLSKSKNTHKPHPKHPSQSQAKIPNFQSIHTKPPGASITRTSSPFPVSEVAAEQHEQHQKIINDLQKQITDPKMIQFIKGDQQVLKLFPIVDLDLLVFKIKKQEIKRKIHSFQKWKIFDYCNVCEWG